MESLAFTIWIGAPFQLFSDTHLCRRPASVNFMADQELFINQKQYKRKHSASVKSSPRPRLLGALRPCVRRTSRREAINIRARLFMVEYRACYLSLTKKNRVRNAIPFYSPLWPRLSRFLCSWRISQQSREGSQRGASQSSYSSYTPGAQLQTRLKLLTTCEEGLDFAL